MADAGYALGYMNNTIYFNIYSVVLQYLVRHQVQVSTAAHTVASG